MTSTNTTEPEIQNWRRVKCRLATGRCPVG